MSAWNDVLSQVENLRAVVEAHARASREDVEQAAAILRRAGSIVYSGVGSGLNACLPAAHYLMERGIPAWTLDATEAIYGLSAGLKHSALVLNTRSGETVELVKLAEIARREGIPTLAVTNEPGSTVGRMANACLPTYSRWDELVVISAYQGMLATELLLAAQVAGQFDAMLADLRRAAEAMSGVLQEVLNQRAALVELFREARPITLLGRGPSIAAALAGELALEEMARRPAVAMVSGLFRQGPIEVVDRSFRALMFEGTGERARLNALLARRLIEQGAGLAWIGPTRLEGALSISLPDLPAHALATLEAVPGYVLAHDLALAAGIEPGSVRYIQKVITTEEGLPNAPEG